MNAVMSGPGEQVLRIATDVAREQLGDDLDAVYALGSLAHGGFAPLVSDVDMAVVLHSVTSATAERVAAIGAEVRRREPSELAARLSVFWADTEGVRTGVGAHMRLPAVDRLDLLDHGRLLHGTDRRAPAERPDAATLVREGAAFAAERFDDAYVARLRRPAELVAAGPRTVTKAVLFPVRFLYTSGTGRIGLNDAAAEWYADHGRHGRLVAAAMGWRHRGIVDAAGATALLDEHLVGLYTEFVDDHRDQPGMAELAERLA